MKKNVTINLTLNLNGDDCKVESQTINNDSANNYQILENPFNHVGLKHNEFLDSVKDFKGTQNELCKLALIYFKEEKSYNISEISNYVDKALKVTPLIHVRNNKTYGKHVDKYINEVSDLIFKPISIDILDVINNIRKLELKALNDENLNEKESQTILSSMSILSNSLKYWFQQEDDWDKPSETDRPFWRKFWKVVGVAAADLGGYFVGEIGSPALGLIIAAATSKVASN